MTRPAVNGTVHRNPVTAVRATEDDVPAVLNVLQRAFHLDPISTWLVPADDRRGTVLTNFFAIIVGQALNHGFVDAHPDRVAAAVWTPSDKPIPHFDTRLADAVGTYHDRFAMLGEAFHRRSPKMRHMYLDFLCVSPQHQRHHLGGALLDHRLAMLDRERIPAYLVASTARSVGLYMRKGFTYHGLPLELPDGGPTVYPMIREVQPVAG